MAKRMLFMLAVVAVLIGALGFVKFRQIQAAIAQGASFQPPPEAVTTAVAESEEWPVTLSAIGTVAAVQGVTVSADMPGVVEKILFESGRTVRAGQVLVVLDAGQERAQLAAAAARRDLARLNFERARGLHERQLISQAEFDRVGAELKQEEAGVAAIRAAIERKTIRAPFSGVVGIRQVNLGQYLAGGDPVVPLQSMDPVYVNFALPQQDVGALRRGAEVQAAADSGHGAAGGRITAINSVVDEATRNVQVQATFANRDGRLRPGMFVDVRVVVGTRRNVIAVPASAIHHAPYGSSVFVVSQLKDPKGKAYRGVRQQFVQLGDGRGDLVAVTGGLRAGQEVATSGVFKLRNGAAVHVDNARQPGSDPAPRPEDS